MALSQQFAQKSQEAGNGQAAIIALMNAIDEEKRAIKSVLSQLSSEPNCLHARGRDRQVKIRRIKTDKKALSRASSSKHVAFTQAFMAAAERILTEPTFIQIEERGAEMLQSE